MPINMPGSGDLPLGFKKGGDTKTWLQNTTPEELFKYLRGDYRGYLSTTPDENINKEIKQKVLHYIWSKTPELQEKYPNFKGITHITEATKVRMTKDPNITPDDTPWISLLALDNELSLYTRGGEINEFTEHFYKINQDGVAEYRWSKTQGEQRVMREKYEASRHLLRNKVDTTSTNDVNQKITQILNEVKQ